MENIIPTEFFAGNRRRLIEALHNDALIVMTANGLLQRGGDNTFPFHQDSSFWYLTGCDLPDIVLVMTGKEEYLIVPGRSAGRQAFDGAVDEDRLAASTGIDIIYGETEGWDKLTAALHTYKRVATPEAPPAYVEQYGMYTNPAWLRLMGRIRDAAPETELTDIRTQLSRMRMVKQPPELEALQKAIDITIDSLDLLTGPKRLGSYRNEYEIEADLTREFRARGASGHAFAPIIAGGKQAVTLHNIANRAPLKSGELVILDVGAEISHYAADITRTVALGEVTVRQRYVYQAVRSVQDYAMTLLKPGAMLREYEKQVEQFMGEKLQALGLIKEPSHDAVRKYYPHAASHFLGLDVHDSGDYSQPLSAGMVLTCEPGIYIPEEGIGVRIEDDVLITGRGNSVLSARLPVKYI